MDESAVDAAGAEAAVVRTENVTSIFSWEGLALRRRPIFSGFLNALDPRFTQIFLRELGHLKKLEQSFVAEVESAVRLGVAATDGW